MHDFLNKPKRHHVKEIPLAPILDLLTVVIFFLILSASFVEMRQNTVPPSSTSVVTGGVANPDDIPLNPKLLMLNKNNEITLMLKWLGAKPGQIVKKLPIKNKKYDFELKNMTTNIIKEFRKDHPTEKQLQLGWSPAIKYQNVLTVVDGALLELKDLVFISPEETETLYEKSI